MTHAFIFGYGSLVNPRSRGPYLRAWAATLLPTAGLRRAWNAHCVWRGTPYTALGLERCDPGVPVNGVLFEVTAERYAELVTREIGYEPITLSVSDISLPAEAAGLSLGPVITWLTREPNRPCAAYPLNSLYIAGCREGFELLGKGEWVTFLETTLGPIT